MDPAITHTRKVPGLEDYASERFGAAIVAQAVATDIEDAAGERATVLSRPSTTGAPSPTAPISACHAPPITEAAAVYAEQALEVG